MAERTHRDIKALVMDVDGTLTNGELYISESGEEFKAFSVKDGYGIHELLPKMGIIPIVITGRTSGIVEHRCKELGISHIYHGVNNKRAVLFEIAEMMSLNPQENIAYIGDDDNDLDAIRVVTLVGCPVDASKNVQACADFISEQKGGYGAVREFIEWIAGDNN